jgi:hypothetical protein
MPNTPTSRGTTPVQVRLLSETLRALRQAADEDVRTLSGCAELAFRKWLADRASKQEARP